MPYRKVSLIFIMIFNLVLFHRAIVAGPAFDLSGKEVRIGGYIESRQFLQTNFHNGEIFGAWNRMMLEFKTSPNKFVDVGIAFRGKMLSGFLTETLVPAESGDFQKIPLDRETLTLDRAYAAIDFGKSRFILGKQVIQQGVAYIFRPLDIYNPTYMLEPSFDIFGISGVRIISSLGQLSEFDAVLIPDKKWSDFRATLRLQTNLSGSDIGISLIHYEKSRYAGIDIKGDLGIGYWFEGLVDMDFPRIKRLSNYTLGFDYTIPVGNGFYFLVEFFHNSRGYSVNNYAENRYAAYLERKQFLGRNYLASLLSYPISNRMTLQTLGVTNLNDKSRIIAIQFDWRPVYNLSINLGNYLNISSPGSEFAPVMPEDLKVYEKPSQFFIWVRADF